MLQSVPIESTHGDESENGFQLVAETTFLHGDRGHSDAKLPEVIQSSDGKGGKPTWEIFRSDTTTHDIIDLDGNAQSGLNVSFYAEEHVIQAVTPVPQEHGKTTSVIGSRPPTPANDVRGPAFQPGGAVPTVARKEGEVIVVASQNRKYRLVAGPPGPVGPWGKRVGLSLSLCLSLFLFPPRLERQNRYLLLLSMNDPSH